MDEDIKNFKPIITISVDNNFFVIDSISLNYTINYEGINKKFDFIKNKILIIKNNGLELCKKQKDIENKKVCLIKSSLIEFWKEYCKLWNSVVNK